MNVEKMVKELREPNPSRGSYAVMQDAASMLERLELENWRMLAKINAHKSEPKS